ncbi:MAG TPA: hypothetical protein HPP77_03785 [Candidatus Hydrogenedentes bacterium]|nr:hypothetical protein [Candidatus Hydrogenedentota bacterium]HIJ73988.1 hypothetical protein [Candidatus Hydrogenedentota bacterium]
MTNQNTSAVPPPTAPGPPPPPGRTGIPVWLIVLIIVVPIAVLVLACGGIMTAITLPTMLLPALSRAQEAAQRASCASNLKQFGVIFKMYANENDNYFPPLAAKPGLFLFEPGLVWPEYMTDTGILICPDDPDVSSGWIPGPGMIQDESYYYLSHVLTNEEQGLAFLDTYRRYMQEGLPFEGDIEAPPGKGSYGSGHFYALREGVEREFAPSDAPSRPYDTQSTVPIMFDRRGNHGATGGNVLYMDGRVEFIPMGQKFPMTETFHSALEQLERDLE